MTKHRDLAYGDPLPESWVDALAEFVSSMATPNFVLTQNTPTSIRLFAGPGNDQVGIGLNGKWRYITAPITKTLAGGGASGNWNIWAIASANNFVATGSPPPAPPESDSTNYAFDLLFLADGLLPSGTGAQALYRLVGNVFWTGSQIASLNPYLGIAGASGTEDFGDGAADDPLAITPALVGSRGNSPRYARSDHTHADALLIGAKAVLAAPQSIASGSPVAVWLSPTLVQNNPTFPMNGTGGGISPYGPGAYHVSARIAWATGGLTSAYVRISVFLGAGETILVEEDYVPAGSTARKMVNGLVFMGSGTAFVVTVQQNSGAPVNLTRCDLQVVKL